LDTLRDIPLAIYWDICLNDDNHYRPGLALSLEDL
jgi:hypothetical protein